MDTTIVNEKPISKLSLGTVQLGMNYGIANFGGQPSLETSFDMLDCALQNGITSLDTARGYGEAEDVLGTYFRAHPQTELPFITGKLLHGNPIDLNDRETERMMYEMAETSLQKLGISRFDCLLLHSASCMHKPIVRETFARMIAEGYTKKVGVSVYLPGEADAMLVYDVYEAIQLPMSMFDQTWIEHGHLERLRENDITVFVRCVFLQGLYFLDPDTITDPLLKTYAAPYLRKLRGFCDRLGMSIAELAISFVRDIPGVTSLVLGADTKEQVLENIRYGKAPAIPASVRAEIMDTFRDVNLDKIMEVLRRPKQ